jgi:TorA maturation chaperone TorD
MTADQQSAAAEDFAAAVASDLDMLAALHDREPTAAIVTALQQAPLEEQLALVLVSEPSLAAFAAFALALDEVPSPIDQAALDDLAAGYADVYLRYTYRASPEESVWLSEDELQRQAAMFDAREFYRRHSLVATDWAKRPEDHLVLELRFLARVLEKQDFAEAARFLDTHLLRWVKRFAVRLVQAGAPNWYAALALLTASYLEELRDYLVELSGVERTKPELERKRVASQTADGPYVPGVAPSW